MPDPRGAAPRPVSMWWLRALRPMGPPPPRTLVAAAGALVGAHRGYGRDVPGGSAAVAGSPRIVARAAESRWRGHRSDRGRLLLAVERPDSHRVGQGARR